MSSEVETVRAMLAAQEAQAGPEAPLTEQRAGMDAFGEAMALREGVSVEETELGGVPGLAFAPAGAAAGRALLYFHGGGYVIGSPRSHKGLVGELCAAMGVVAYSMDYRLAPEAPFPAAVEDGVAAYRALVEDKGVAPGGIVIGGDSAGGGLTLATALRARELGLPMPAGLVLFSPWADLACDSWSFTEKAALDPMVKKPRIDEMAAHYLGGRDPRDPGPSPIHADLAGLPPLLIQVGAEETLLADSVTLAGRAGAANVEVRLEIQPDMIHVYQAFYPLLSDARAAIDRVGAWAASRYKT